LGKAGICVFQAKLSLSGLLNVVVKYFLGFSWIGFVGVLKMFVVWCGFVLLFVV